MGDGDVRLTEITIAEAMRRLASVPLGRVVFTSRALPAIQPVCHLVDDSGHVIIRCPEDSAIVGAASAERGAVVAYEADDAGSVPRGWWSVLVVGLARLVDDPQEADRYRDNLKSLVPGSAGYVIRIYPELVTSFQPGNGQSPPGDSQPLPEGRA